MHNSTSGNTPKTSKTVKDQQSSSNNGGAKNSAKKLKQARLPFKIIAPSTSPADSKPATTAEAGKNSSKDGTEFKNGQSKESTTDARKRKLSYDDSDGESGVIDVDDDDNISKENIEVLAASSKKKKIAESSYIDGTLDDIVILDDDSNESVPDTINTVAVTQETIMKTPKDLTNEKRKGAGTPCSSGSAQNEKSGSASKLKIKLPLSSGKKSKRRKSKLTFVNKYIDEGDNNRSCAESTDDMEEVAIDLNPQKRKKLDIEDVIQDKKQIVKNHEDEAITLNSDPEVEEDKSNDKQEDVRVTLKNKSIEKTKGEVDKNKDKLKKSTKESPISSDKTEKSARKSNEKSQKEIEEITKASDSSDEDQNEDKEDLNESIQSDNDNEADDETDNKAAKRANISSDISEDPKSKNNNTMESSKNPDNGICSTKNLTPKQTKLMNQRRKAREEKERKLQEEKMKKQLEKEEKEQAKKRERDEKEEQRRKDREEKEEQKRKEREEKERKRLVEVEAKNEEKRKKNEAKEEELRKKEEERKRKEQEKEEAELKKKKAAQAFTKFFVPKAASQAQINNEDDSNTGDGTKLLAFRPFQVKGDMILAPLCRKIFTKDARYRLDSILGCRHKNISRESDNVEYEKDEDEENIIHLKPLPTSQLYLSELRAGNILPGKWRRPSTDSKDDVILVEDDLDRVGQAIVEDSPAIVREQMRVKFFKFHDNRRPPYYGTWRKKSSVIKPTKPFKQDKKFFDYEVDSDDEWEEEEPGESLEDGSDDDKEKESEDEDYEVDNEWFVPHGHLSDEELQNEDEFGTGDNNTREAQKAKLQILQQEFVQEMKKKTEKIKPRLIGCIWVDENGNQPTECAKIIWDTLKNKAMLYTDPPIVEEPEVDRSTEPSSPSASNSNAEKVTTLKPICLSDNMVKDLTRLIHGNHHSKNFLINEYIAYIEKTEESIKNGDLRKPLKSVVRDKIDEMAEWQVVNATASNVQEMEQVNDEITDSKKKKKKSKRRLCWVVKQDMLDKMDLSLLELQNSWKYTLPPKYVKSDKNVKPDESSTTKTTTTTQSASNECNPATDTSLTIRNSKIKNTSSKIKKFTKILTAEEKVKKLQTPTTPSRPVSHSSNIKSVMENKTKTPTSQTSKEKKRVPLLMSVAHGQQISTPTKNKLISQFLQMGNKDSATKPSSSSTRSSRINATTSPTIEDDDVVILD